MKLKMLMLGMVLGLMAATTGCNSVPVNANTNYTKEVGIACAAVSTSYKAILIANDNGKVTKAQQDQVLAAMKVTDPVCGSDAAPTLSELAYSAFLQAVAVLQRTEASTR